MKKFIVLAFFLLPLTSYGAIAFDSYTEATFNAGTSRTWSHTITGSNPILFVYAWVNGGSETITGITYNGTAMTQAAEVTSYNGATNHAYLYYLNNPDVGTHNIVASFSSSVTSALIGASYTGAAQSGIDSIFDSPGDGSSSSYTIDTTVVENDSWLVSASTGLDGACSGVGATTTLRATTNPILGDSGGPVQSGVRSLSYTSCGARVEDKIIASFAPYVVIEPETTATSTSIDYHDWILVNSVIIGLLGFIGIGFILNPIK